MRFFARFISLIFLVAAVIAATLDSIQSVAVLRVTLVSLGDALLTLDQNTPTQIEQGLTNLLPLKWLPAFQWLLAQSACAVFLVLSLVFWVLGYRRKLPSIKDG